MKIILQEKNYFVLRFDKDEEVLEGLRKFMQEQAVSACAFFGVGACSSAELLHYNSHVKVYRSKPYFEDLEMVSFGGNGGVMDDKPILHVHGSFGRNDFTVIGGHVDKAVVSGTCEIFLTKLEGALERKQNQDLNLNLLM
jgi:predicted DNA-binding protein with PD1-like motif